MKSAVACADTEDRQARVLIVTGRVQGVGYRPFVYVTARALGLGGTVLNGAGKVLIHVEGPPAALARFERALIEEAPPLARPAIADSAPADWTGHEGFEILASKASDDAEIHVPPDLFTCDDCLAEVRDPAERRHGYPFINCTQCGPRYTLITAMPYDRPNTSMAGFPLCPECRAEYRSPLDRRFHAQPLACPVCGPRLAFGSSDNEVDTRTSLDAAATALRRGAIVAVKGVGGYHLVCDAADHAAVQRLRARKHRPDKPLAVMFPWRGADGLECLHEHVHLDAVTAAAVTGPARPIVLARKRRSSTLSTALAPGLVELGVFLPYSPLHHLLLEALGRPLVATSGNISGEPVITVNDEAHARLGSVADFFLDHNRPIVRPADDPVLRPLAGAARVIRIGRGIGPLEIPLARPIATPTLAVGGHMKNTIALAWGDRAVVSPHIGDLDSPRSREVFVQVVNDLQNLYDVKCQQIVCDLHPGYASSRWAAAQSLPVRRVQHHHAHASALAGEFPDVGRWLVFAWDGVGLGDDGTLWGGEALIGRPGNWRRAASFRPFQLVGGDRAGREPWRAAAALMWVEGREFAPAVAGWPLAREAWLRGVGVHASSAAGRLFDAAAALVLRRFAVSYEGQGPMELEQVADGDAEPLSLPLRADAAGIWRTDWGPLLPVLADAAIAPAERAAIFHASLAEALVMQARRIRERYAFDAVGLGGGVFQNRRLCEWVIRRLREEGIETFLPAEVPANDGGLSFGQIVEAAGVAGDG